jgi:hypothetical protein
MYALDLPEGQELFFTEVSTIAVPFSSGPAALAIPLSRWHLLVFRQGVLTDDEKAEVQILRASGALELFSLGVGSEVHRVVLPPEWRDAAKANPTGTAQNLVDMRRSARAAYREITGDEPT